MEFFERGWWNFPTGERVWVVKKGERKKTKHLEKRKGIIRFLHPNFIGIWVQTSMRPSLGWIECFLKSDIENGKIIISRRKEKQQNELSCG